MGKTDFIKPIIDDAVRGILDLLGSGRADEITDSMLDLGDPVMNARLNEALWQNYDLPMGYTSRMERAVAGGRTTPAYRGTLSDEVAARNYQFVSERPSVAQGYAGYIDFADEIGLPPELAQQDGGNMMPLIVDPSANTSIVSGYELKLPGDRIRSRFARFDPRLAHLKNLNAALAGGAGVTGLLSMSPEEAAAAEIDAYLKGKR